jgi:hypothetical protein
VFQKGTYWHKGVDCSLARVLKSGEVINPDTELTFHEKYDDAKAEWDVIHRVQPRIPSSRKSSGSHVCLHLRSAITI